MPMIRFLLRYITSGISLASISLALLAPAAPAVASPATSPATKTTVLPLTAHVRIPLNAGQRVAILNADGSLNSYMVANAGDYFSNGNLYNSQNQLVTECRTGCSSGSVTISGSLPSGSNVIGGVTQSGSWTVTVTQATGSNLHMVCDSGCGGGPVTNAGTSATTAAAIQGVTGGVAVPISGSVSVSNFPASTQSAQASAGNIVPTVGDTTVAININTATTTQLIALSGSKLTYITSIFVMANNTDNVTLEFGTGAACGTGTTAITGLMTFTPQFAFYASAINGAIVVPAGQAFCILTSATSQLSGWITYAQHS